MILYTKSASFSSTELNSESSLNVTDLVVNDNLQSINLISSLVLSYNSPNSVSFTFFDGFTDIGSANFNVTFDIFNTNATDFTVSSSSTYNLYDIVYGNGKYVVAIYNNSKYAYSTDGENFSLSTVHSSWIFSDTVYPMSIIYGNNLFILHSGRYVYHSSNGTSWTRTSLPNGKNNYRASYSLYGNGVFVLTLINQNYMYYSTNGTSWTAVSSSSKTYTGAAYGAGKFVYITSSGETIYSSNGSSWSTGSIGSGSNWNALCYGNDKFVAISTDGSVAISTNGTSWTYYSGKLTAKTWISVDYGNNMFVAIAQSSNVLAASFDGITWYETTIESTNRSWMKIRYTNNIFWGLAASNSSGKKFNPELLFKLDPTENTISNTHTIENSTLSLTYSKIPTLKSGKLDATFTLENNHVATLTQKYYIDGTTTSIKDDDAITIDKGTSWSFMDYPSEITYNGDRYIFSSITGDNASGTNLDSDKERIIYYTKYIPPVYTLTQKYYIKGTTTSLRTDTVTNATEGDSWAFSDYPSTITVGDDEYIFDSVSGDEASGTNINSNKERIVYYTYVLKTFTLTQNYYIDGTTTPLQDATIISVTEGDSWAFMDYPSKITVGDNEYVFSSVTGDSASGTNLDSNKERIIYYTYVPKVYTLTQKYYIKDTTTPIKEATVINATEGNDWSFDTYPSKIIYNRDSYAFNSITGDSASGTNLDSNKERIIYYVRYEGPIIAGSGNVEFPLSIPMMSCLYNDMNMCYIKKYLVDYTTLNENTNINLGNLVNSHKIYKIKVIYKNTVDTLIEFNIADIKFIVNGTFTIGSVDTNITIINNCVILTHSNTTMSSGSIEIHLYCKP